MSLAPTRPCPGYFTRVAVRTGDGGSAAPIPCPGRGGWTLFAAGDRGSGIYCRRGPGLAGTSRFARPAGSDRCRFPAGLDLATTTDYPAHLGLPAFGLHACLARRRRRYGAGGQAASGGRRVRGPASLLARQGAARVIGGVRSPGPRPATLAAAYTPVTHGEGFVCQGAAKLPECPDSTSCLNPSAAAFLASFSAELAIGRARFVSYGAAAGEPDPAATARFRT